MTEKVTLTSVTQDQSEQPSDENIEVANSEDTVIETESGGSLWGRFLVSIVIIGLLVAVGKLAMDVNILKKNLEPDAFIKQDNLILDDLASQQKSLTTQIKLLAQQQENLAENFKSFQNDVDSIKASQNKSTSVLSSTSEFKFLIEKANFKLNYENDPKGALAILNLLSKKLNAKSDLYQSVQTMIEQIKPFASIDTSELLAKLEVLENDLAALPITLKTKISETTDENVKQDQTSLTWKDKLLASLKEVVVIQRVDQPVKPLLTQHERALLQYQLKLKVQQAKMSLLTHQYTVFVDQIRTLQSDVSPYIDAKENISLDNAFKYFLEYPFPTRMPDLNQLQQAVKKMEKAKKS